VTDIETWDLDTVHMFMDAVSDMADFCLHISEILNSHLAMPRLTGNFHLRVVAST